MTRQIIQTNLESYGNLPLSLEKLNSKGAIAGDIVSSVYEFSNSAQTVVLLLR